MNLSRFSIFDFCYLQVPHLRWELDPLNYTLEIYDVVMATSGSGRLPHTPHRRTSGRMVVHVCFWFKCERMVNHFFYSKSLRKMKAMICCFGRWVKAQKGGKNIGWILEWERKSQIYQIYVSCAVPRRKTRLVKSLAFHQLNRLVLGTSKSGGPTHGWACGVLSREGFG